MRRVNDDRTSEFDRLHERIYGLRMLPTLRLLCVIRTQVTPDGVAELEQVRPDLAVSTFWPSDDKPAP